MTVVTPHVDILKHSQKSKVCTLEYVLYDTPYHWHFSESPPLYMDLAVAVVTPRVDLAFDGYTEGVVGAAAHVCHVCVDGLYHL